MSVNILMPALSPTMTEGTLARWLKEEGQQVRAGDVIAEIETDKATMEVEAVDEGILGKILVAGGTEGVKVNEIIAVLLEEGESAASLKTPVASSPSSPSPVAPVTAPAAKPTATVMTAANTGNRILVSPLARRIAAEKGINLQTLKGTGPNGRIVRADVENLKSSPSIATAPSTVAVDTGVLAIDAAGLPPFRLEAHSTMRKVIAKRLTESKQTVPHFYLAVDVGLDALLDLRKTLAKRGEESKFSVNDFIIRAVALALKDEPAANAAWTEEGGRYFERADVAVAVAIEGGLITPIIRGAEQKRLPQISAEMKDLAVRARAGKLKPEEFTGGTFSLSNLGMFGIKQFSAIVNPPQACILAVGAGEPRAVVDHGAVKVATQMTCTLSVDHRIVDGAVGAAYLAAFKARIEDPLSLLL